MVIPNNRYGSQANCVATSDCASLQISVPTTENFSYSSIQVDVHLTHSKGGDIILHLRNPQGTIITLLHKAGELSGSVTARGAEMDFLYPVQFDDQCGKEYAEFIERLVPSGSNIIPAGTIVKSSNESDPPASTLSTITPGTTQGVWTLFVGDSKPGSDGSDGILL